MRKLNRAASVVSVPAFLALLGMFLTNWGGKAVLSPSLPPRFVMLGLIGLLFLGIWQTYVRYQRETYNPTFAIRLYDDWRERGMERDRASAASALKKYQGRLSEIDELRDDLAPIDLVLDHLDMLGFLVHGNQISPEVAHQYFFDWVRGYWLTARPYISAVRSRPGQRSMWERIEPLYKELCAVDEEKQSVHDAMSANEISDFLEGEISMNEESGLEGGAETK